MIKKAVVLLILAVLPFTLSAMTLEGYEPYAENEFPHWAIETRRAECIFFGAVPLVYPFVSMAFNQFNSSPEITTMLLTSCGIAVTIAITDFILGVMQNDN